MGHFEGEVHQLEIPLGGGGHAFGESRSAGWCPHLVLMLFAAGHQIYEQLDPWEEIAKGRLRRSTMGPRNAASV